MEGDEPTTNYYPDVRTLYELFLRGLRESSEFPPVFTSMLMHESKGVTFGLIWDLFSLADNGPCLGTRKPNQPYEWQSYQEASTRTRARALPLLELESGGR